MELTLKYPIRQEKEASGHLLGYHGLMQNLTDALRMEGVKFTDAAEVVFNIAPPHLLVSDHDRPTIGLSMWENINLPKHMMSYLAPIDRLIVPSSFCATVFRRAGYRRPIHVAPLGLWPHHWPDPPPVRDPERPRRFLWIGSRDTRKGPMILWRAWCETFTAADPVHLVVKTSITPGDDWVPSAAQAKVKVLSYRMPWPELQALYLSADVLVCTSVGEGFGLIPLEGMAAGALVISPNHTGLRDFVHKRVAWILSTKDVRGEYGVATTMPAPRVSHLRHLLRQAADPEVYASTEPLRLRAAQWARQFSWQRTAREVMRVVEQVQKGRVA